MASPVIYPSFPGAKPAGALTARPAWSTLPLSATTSGRVQQRAVASQSKRAVVTAARRACPGAAAKDYGAFTPLGPLDLLQAAAAADSPPPAETSPTTVVSETDALAAAALGIFGLQGAPPRVSAAQSS
jgi:hypothetical protein